MVALGKCKGEEYILNRCSSKMFRAYSSGEKLLIKNYCVFVMLDFEKRQRRKLRICEERMLYKILMGVDPHSLEERTFLEYRI
jgi:hypothetical protein